MDFKIYEKLNIPICVIDTNNKVIFYNYAFKVEFKNFEKFDRFKNNFDIEACYFDLEKNISYTPIDFAMNSKEDFFAFLKYPNNSLDQFYELFCNNDFLPYKVLVFLNVTNKIKFNENFQELCELRIIKNKLEKENKKISNIKHDAQLQALKTTIINRINSKIRKSINIDEIILEAIKELMNLFGAFKVCFAKCEKNDKFKIQNVYPNKYKNDRNELFELTKEDFNKLPIKKYISSYVLKASENSKKFFPMAVNRIIIPIFHQKKLLGIVVSYTKQNVSLINNEDIIVSIQTQLSQALFQANLFEKIKTTNRELKNAMNELKETQVQLINSEKMASLGLLIAGIAHEINTPLASVKSNNSLREKIIQKIHTEGYNDDLLEKIQYIDSLDAEAIKRIMNIVVGLKKFVRLDEAEIQYSDINCEIDLTLELIYHELKNIEIVKNYSNLPPIKCYPNLLNQVFMNILINAIQSIKNNGKIIVSTNINDNYLIITIEDNGSGIDKSNLEKIFDPGYTTKPLGIGTGLGLAICRKIIEKHFGSINVNSVLNKGTIFTIKIPIL